MSGRRRRRPEGRRNREHRFAKQHHRHAKATADGLCLVSTTAADQCAHSFHVTEDERMGRLLDFALDQGEICIDTVWRLVFVPDVVAIEVASESRERAAELEQAWQAQRFDGRVVYVWRLPDDLAA